MNIRSCECPLAVVRNRSGDTGRHDLKLNRVQAQGKPLGTVKFLGKQEASVLLAIEECGCCSAPEERFTAGCSSPWNPATTLPGRGCAFNTRSRTGTSVSGPASILTQSRTGSSTTKIGSRPEGVDGSLKLPSDGH